MTISPLNFAIILTGTIVLTAVLTYYLISLIKVNRSSYDRLRDEQQVLQGKINLLELQKQQTDKEMERAVDQLEALRTAFNEMNTRRIAAEEKVQNLKDSLDHERGMNDKQHNEIGKLSAQTIEMSEQLAVQRARLENLQEKLITREKDFEELRKRSLDEFKLAANELLEEKSQRFARFNKENMELILKPLGENLREFKKQVRETYDAEARERFSLKDRISELMELNSRISKEAQNLTNALKGQAKTQGDWGEMILENILEYSGLTKNREYFVQDSFKDEQGLRKQPDVIVKYPDERYIIIDSKVSLTAYERFMQSEDPGVQKIEQEAHVRSVKAHIDNLSGKEYEAFDKTLDFVMLFVPIEPAYLLAMQHDPALWNYAYERRILLISPTNLIAALKMVSDIWKRDDQNRNAREIARRGEILYDKFVGFLGDMENIEKYISRAGESWKEAMTKLKTGRGNLIGQAEKLRKLGLKPKKSLPGGLIPDEEE
jgi:DNA recombination protein RmuC